MSLSTEPRGFHINLAYRAGDLTHRFCLENAFYSEVVYNGTRIRVSCRKVRLMQSGTIGKNKIDFVNDKRRVRLQNRPGGFAAGDADAAAGNTGSEFARRP